MKIRLNRAVMLFSTVLIAGAVSGQIEKKPTTQIEKMPPGVTKEIAEKHVMRPAHIDFRASDDDLSFESTTPETKVVVKKGKKYGLNANAFGDALHARLKDSVTGYVMQLAQNGNVIYSLTWRKAQTSADNNTAWDGNVRMHVASVSKYITAVAMMKALKLKGISYDAHIINYLPKYWNKGSNIDKITFRHLLTHNSGFQSEGSSSDYEYMKAQVSKGVPGVGSDYHDYENMNFGLCRILIPVVMGNIDKNVELHDWMWDVITIGWYKSFVQDRIFTPSQVVLADFAPSPYFKDALAYKFPYNGEDGWGSGDLSSVSGGAGWRLSTSELIRVMHFIRRKNVLLPSTEIQYGLDNKFGLNNIIETDAGRLYYKKGGWRNSGRREQSVIYMMPENLELVLFVNSPIGKANADIAGVVKTAYLGALIEK